MRVAAIDCGTNSTRLLVAETSDDARGFAIVDRRMRITRLGQGVNATKMLAPEAIERTASVLREYRAAMDEHGVERVRITATSAARDAANREDFFSVAKEIVGVEPELLSGDEEADLSFRGATADLDPDSRRSTMIVLPRKKNESVVIGDDIILTVIEVRGDKVRLGIEHPKGVTVHRREIYEAIHSQQEVGQRT